MGIPASQSHFLGILTTGKVIQLQQSPLWLFLGIQLSESETKTCFLKMEWCIAGEADSTVGGSMVIPMSL